MNLRRRFLKRDVDAANGQTQLLLPLVDAKRLSAAVLSQARTVIVVGPIESLNASVHVRTERRSSHELASTVQRLYVNGERAGQFDRLGDVAYRELQPLRLHGVRMKLSDGQTVTVWSRTLTAVVRWESKRRPEDGSKYWFCHKKEITSDTATMRLNRKLDWGTANKLRPGDQVTIEYPFQWVNGELTNGVISFPPQRPHGKEWRKYSIDPVPESCWDDFLDGLEGKFMHELLPHHKEVTTSKKTEQQALTARQSEIQRVIRGGMWKGEGCEHVAFGRNLMFIVKREKRAPLFVVDNAGVGRVYVFRDEKYARDFARGVITRTTAIKDGSLRLVHAGKWQIRLARILQAC